MSKAKPLPASELVSEVLEYGAGHARVLAVRVEEVLRLPRRPPYVGERGEWAAGWRAALDAVRRRLDDRLDQ